MGGIKDLLGFHFWLDNSKKLALESLLSDQKQIPKDRLSILRDLQLDQPFETEKEDIKYYRNYRKKNSST